MMPLGHISIQLTRPSRLESVPRVCPCPAEFRPGKGTPASGAGTHRIATNLEELT